MISQTGFVNVMEFTAKTSEYIDEFLHELLLGTRQSSHRFWLFTFLTIAKVSIDKLRYLCDVMCLIYLMRLVHVSNFILNIRSA